MRIRLVSLSILILLFAAAGSAQTRGMAFVRFANHTDFEGTWDPGLEMPRYLGAFLRAEHRLSVVSASVVGTFREDLSPIPAWDDVKFWRQVRQRFGVRYLVTGTVEVFDISRFVTGQPAVGGYEAFKGEVTVTYEVIDLDRLERSGDLLITARGESRGEFADRALAWTLLGKPTQRTVEFRDLNTLRFGGEEFARTVIGQACLESARRFADDLLERIPGLAAHRSAGELEGDWSDSTQISFRERVVEGKIVFMEGSDAFISLGTDDGVREGQVLPVVEQAGDESRQVATIRVVQVRGPHLSLARFIAGSDSATTSSKVRLRVVE
ncbi:MAG: hypothetical protein MUE68_13270 [Bacteroidetes bacterium]|jgi:hypothetical protein|nr:hypothetical protein [Bacteroidota bacterium]